MIHNDLSNIQQEARHLFNTQSDEKIKLLATMVEDLAQAIMDLAAQNRLNTE